MPNPLAVTLRARAEIAADGESSAVDLGALRTAVELRVTTDGITPAGASPLLVIETRDAETSVWRKVDSEQLQNGAIQIDLVELDRYVRLRWVMKSATSAFVAVSGVAHVVYCSTADLERLQVPGAAIEEVSQRAKASACIAASSDADGYIASSHTMPLVAWGPSLRAKTGALALAYVFSKRGVDPEGADAVVFDMRDKALSWFDRLADGRIQPPEIVDSTPEVCEGGAVVLSRPKRGW